jgi:hypothetical protein
MSPERGRRLQQGSGPAACTGPGTQAAADKRLLLWQREGSWHLPGGPGVWSDEAEEEPPKTSQEANE